MTRLIISPEASADLQEIGDFIARDNLEAAISFVILLNQRCNALVPFPGVGRKRDEIKVGYRSISEGEYIIFYRLKTDEVVEVMRIVHGKRDLGKALSD